MLLGSGIGGQYRFYMNSKMDEGRDLVINENRRGWVDHHGPPGDDVIELWLQPSKKPHAQQFGEDGEENEPSDGSDGDDPPPDDHSDGHLNASSSHDGSSEGEGDNPEGGEEEGSEPETEEDTSAYEDAQSQSHHTPNPPSTPTGQVQYAPMEDGTTTIDQQFFTPGPSTPGAAPQYQAVLTPAPPAAPPAPTQAVQPRRSGRASKKPDFYTPSGAVAVAQVAQTHRDPLSVPEAIATAEKEEWKQAMQAEYNALMANDT